MLGAGTLCQGEDVASTPATLATEEAGMSASGEQTAGQSLEGETLPQASPRAAAGQSLEGETLPQGSHRAVTGMLGGAAAPACWKG